MEKIAQLVRLTDATPGRDDPYVLLFNGELFGSMVSVKQLAIFAERYGYEVNPAILEMPKAQAWALSHSKEIYRNF